MMKYIIYKITNKMNNKIYIGKHQTIDINDDYMGSGKWLRRAQLKYGIENFEKEILFVFETEEEMNLKEAEIVTEHFCLDENTYNICVGGKGGFSYINREGLNGTYEGRKKGGLTNREKSSAQLTAQNRSADFHKKRVLSIYEKYGKSGFATFKGKRHTDETKDKISKSKKGITVGNKNSQFGTVWVTNENETIKIKKDDVDKYLLSGYRRGRKCH